MQRDSIDFSSSDVGKLFRRFLFPTVMGMVFSAVFVITDGIFVGRGIGSDALASVNIVAPLFTLGTGLGLMFGMGGSVVSFAVRSADAQQGRARTFALIDHTQLCSITSNLGDVKTTITHPASTSHGRLTEDQRQAAGIGQGLIRVAVGLEHMDDIQADLARGLEALA